MSSPTVGIVVPNYQGEHLLPGCLDALTRQDGSADEVVVVDNGSTDGSLALLASDYPDVQVLRNERNLGFGAAANRGVGALATDRVVVLNSDARPQRDWLAELLRVPPEQDVWAWGSVLLRGSDGPIESAGDTVTRQGQAYKLYGEAPLERLPAEPFEVLGPAGAAPMFRRDVFEGLGGYDDRFFLYYEDVDLSLRARLAGWRAVTVPSARVVHLQSASSNVGLIGYYVGRNSLVANVRANPTASPRGLLRVTRRELRWAAGMGARRDYLRGRIAGILHLPQSLLERRSIVGRWRGTTEAFLPPVPVDATS